MEILYTKDDLSKFRNLNKSLGKKMGLVPTMGALHQGHISLIQKAKETTDVVIASIFVNPTQFNNPEDFKKYPITIDQDLEILMKNGCDAVFIPSVEEIYKRENYTPYTLDMGDLEQILEGEKRPGHFKGVIEIVYILFDWVQPDFVFFGLKDYQQVLVIEKLIEKMNQNIQLVKCETVREDNGLAMSSRNKRLNKKEKAIASNLFKTLTKIKDSYKKSDISILKNGYIDKLNSMEKIKVDYIDIVDSQTLTSLKTWNPKGKNLAILAVFVGEVRLIDNLLF